MDQKQTIPKIKDPEKNDLYTRLSTICQAYSNFCNEKKTAYTATYRVFRCLLQSNSAFNSADFKTIFCNGWRILNYCVTYKRDYCMRLCLLKSLPENNYSKQTEILHKKITDKLTEEIENNATIESIASSMSRMYLINSVVYPYVLVGALSFAAKLYVSDNFGLTTVSAEDHSKHKSIPWVVSLHTDKRIFTDETNVSSLADKLIKAERDIEWLMTNIFIGKEKPRPDEYTNFYKCLENPDNSAPCFANIRKKISDDQLKVIKKYAENEKSPFYYSLYDEFTYEDPLIWDILQNNVQLDKNKLTQIANESSIKNQKISYHMQPGNSGYNYNGNTSKMFTSSGDDQFIPSGYNKSPNSYDLTSKNTSYTSFVGQNTSFDASTISLEKSLNTSSVFNQYMKSNILSGNSQNIHGNVYKIKINSEKSSVIETSCRISDPNMSLSSVLSNVSILKNDQSFCSFIENENSFMYNPSRKTQPASLGASTNSLPNITHRQPQPNQQNLISKQPNLIPKHTAEYPISPGTNYQAKPLSQLMINGNIAQNDNIIQNQEKKKSIKDY